MLTRVPLTLTFDLDLWPWIFKVKLYLGNGRPDCHWTKGTAVDRMPWCETVRKWVNWTLHWLGYYGPWPLTLDFQGVKLYLGNGRPDCHGTKGMGVNRMPWCKRKPLCDLEAEEIVRDQGDLRCRRFRRLILVFQCFIVINGVLSTSDVVTDNLGEAFSYRDNASKFRHGDISKMLFVDLVQMLPCLKVCPHQLCNHWADAQPWALRGHTCLFLRKVNKEDIRTTSVDHGIAKCFIQKASCVISMGLLLMTVLLA